MLPLLPLRKSGADVSAGRLRERPGQRPRRVPLGYRLLPSPAQRTAAKRAVTRLSPTPLPVSRELLQADICPKYSIEMTLFSATPHLRGQGGRSPPSACGFLPTSWPPLLGCISWSLALSPGLDIGMSGAERWAIVSTNLDPLSDLNQNHALNLLTDFFALSAVSSARMSAPWRRRYLSCLGLCLLPQDSGCHVLSAP